MSSRQEWIDVVDENGRRSRLRKVTPRTFVSNLGGGKWMDELSSIYDEAGQSVNSLKDGTFQGVHDGKIYRPVS